METQWRAYDSFLEKGTYNYICKGNLIKWNEKLNIVVNPGAKAQILFTKRQLLEYCLWCEKKEECNEKDNVASIVGEEREINPSEK